MSNVVSLFEKKERWNTILSHGELLISVSNHGRLSFTLKDQLVTLSMFDSVCLLQTLKKSFYEE